MSDVDFDLGVLPLLCKGQIQAGFHFEKIGNSNNLIWTLERQDKIVAYAVCEESWEHGSVDLHVLCSEPGYGKALFKQVLMWIINEIGYSKLWIEPVNKRVANLFRDAIMEFTGITVDDIDVDDGSIRQKLDIFEARRGMRLYTDLAESTVKASKSVGVVVCRK
jgi:hypothetical protein